MQQPHVGAARLFQYSLKGVTNDLNFLLTTKTFSSISYDLEVYRLPKLQNLKIFYVQR